MQGRMTRLSRTRSVVFIKGLLIGFCSCSILLYTLNFCCKHDVLQTRIPLRPVATIDVNADSGVLRAHKTITETSHNVLSSSKFRRTIPNEEFMSKLRWNERGGPRILCWVMTTESNLMTKDIHVYNTWGKRCDKILFFTSTGQKSSRMTIKKLREQSEVIGEEYVKVNISDPNEIPEHEKQTISKMKIGHDGNTQWTSNQYLPVVRLTSAPEGRRHLTTKMMSAFVYIHRHYLEEYDWFLKADDDTYIVMENLRHFLSRKDKDIPVYYGHHFYKLFIASGYNQGGAGYVLSQAALRRFGTGYSKTKNCYLNGEDEDVDMGRCLQHVGGGIGDTGDENRAIRFLPFTMEKHFLTGLPPWTNYVFVYGVRTGINSVSPDVISFHYVEPWMMYVLDYFVYRFKLSTEGEISEEPSEQRLRH